jgi:hypothetical protein
VYLEEIAESLRKSAASLRPAGTPISSFLYTPKGSTTAFNAAPAPKPTFETVFSPAAQVAAPAPVVAPALVAAQAPAMSLQPKPAAASSKRAPSPSKSYTKEELEHMAPMKVKALAKKLGLP